MLKLGVEALMHINQPIHKVLNKESDIHPLPHVYFNDAAFWTFSLSLAGYFDDLVRKGLPEELQFMYF